MLRARGLTVRRGERVLFGAFDLSLTAGETVWLRAANGFGKTSLLRVLAGLATPDAGDIERHPTAPLVYLAHANALKDDLTASEALRFLAALNGLRASDAMLSDALTRMGMRTRRQAHVRTLSQGQRRRVALARLCLSAAPATWLLDEPFDALDTEASAIVGALLRTHAERGGCTLLTSHVTPDTSAGALREVQLDAVGAQR